MCLALQLGSANEGHAGFSPVGPRLVHIRLWPVGQASPAATAATLPGPGLSPNTAPSGWDGKRCLLLPVPGASPYPGVSLNYAQKQPFRLYPLLPAGRWPIWDISKNHTESKEDRPTHLWVVTVQQKGNTPTEKACMNDPPILGPPPQILESINTERQNTGQKYRRPKNFRLINPGRLTYLLLLPMSEVGRGTT